MIKINLLPFKRKRASTLTKDIRDLVLALIVVCIGFGYYYYLLTNEIKEHNTNIANIKKEINSLQPIAQEYKQIQEAKKEIERRIQTLNQLKSGRALAARSLYDISSIIKEGVWIKSIKKTENKFEIDGRSFVNESISDFIESLSKMSYITNVELKNVQDINEEGLTIKKFIITGNMSI
jgi:type IV pilus assembly protein PilN